MTHCYLRLTFVTGLFESLDGHLEGAGERRCHGGDAVAASHAKRQFLVAPGRLERVVAVREGEGARVDGALECAQDGLHEELDRRHAPRHRSSYRDDVLLAQQTVGRFAVGDSALARSDGVQAAESGWDTNASSGGGGGESGGEEGRNDTNQKTVRHQPNGPLLRGILSEQQCQPRQVDTSVDLVDRLTRCRYPEVGEGCASEGQTSACQRNVDVDLGRNVQGKTVAPVRVTFSTHDSEDGAFHGDEGTLTTARAARAELAVVRVVGTAKDMVESVTDLSEVNVQNVEYSLMREESAARVRKGSRGIDTQRLPFPSTLTMSV